MPRLIIAIIFVCAFVVSAGFYLFGEREHPAEKVKGGEETPRIAMTTMHQWRYRGTVPHTHLSAGRAEFYEPNVVKMFDGVTLVRGARGKEIHVRTAAAEARLSAQKLEDVFGDTKVTLVESLGPVTVEARDSVLVAESAQFLPEDSIMQSEAPFKLSGPGRLLSGKQGFRYDLSKEKISVPGPVEGVLNRGKVIPRARHRATK